MKIVTYMFAKSFSLETEVVSWSPGATSLHFSWVRFHSLHIPSVLPDRSETKSRSVQEFPPQAFICLCRQLKLLAQTIRSQILFVYASVWGAHSNTWVWDLETAVLTNTTCVERGRIQLDIHEQVEKNPGFVWYLETKFKRKDKVKIAT